jgi:hypothetical protein
MLKNKNIINKLKKNDFSKYCKYKLIDLTFNFYFQYKYKNNFILIQHLKNKINYIKKIQTYDIIGCGSGFSYIYNG